jgi:glucans biosynthesis protein C
MSILIHMKQILKAKSVSEDVNVRLRQFDNYRFLLVILVVLGHTLMGFTFVNPWWPVLDNTQNSILASIIIIGDAFAMPAFFFISGFFTPGSIARRGIKGFIFKRVRSIMIPWLIGVVFIVPPIIYIYNENHLWSLTTNPMDYFHFWKLYLIDFCQFYTGFYPIPSNATLVLYNQMHLWFLPVLFFISCFAGFIMTFPRLKSKLKTEFGKVRMPIFLMFFWLFGGGSIFLPNLLNADYTWYYFCNIIQIQPSRIGLYFGYFFFGMYACYWGLGVHLSAKDGRWMDILLVTVLIFSSFALYSAATVQTGIMSSNFVQKIIYSSSRSLVCLSLFLIFLRFFILTSKGNRNRFLEKLRKYSFSIYILHLPIVVGLQYFFVDIHGIHYGIKIASIFFGTLLLSIVLSHAYFIIRQKLLEIVRI